MTIGVGAIKKRELGKKCEKKPKKVDDVAKRKKEAAETLDIGC